MVHSCFMTRQAIGTRKNAASAIMRDPKEQAQREREREQSVLLDSR